MQRGGEEGQKVGALGASDKAPCQAHGSANGLIPQPNLIWPEENGCARWVSGRLALRHPPLALGNGHRGDLVYAHLGVEGGAKFLGGGERRALANGRLGGEELPTEKVITGQRGCFDEQANFGRAPRRHHGERLRQSGRLVDAKQERGWLGPLARLHYIGGRPCTRPCVLHPPRFGKCRARGNRCAIGDGHIGHKAGIGGAIGFGEGHGTGRAGFAVHKQGLHHQVELAQIGAKIAGGEGLEGGVGWHHKRVFPPQGVTAVLGHSPKNVSERGNEAQATAVARL